MAELVCRDLTLGYKNNVLVKNLSFEVNKGDYLCVVGQNGAGKSTLIKTILNLQKSLHGVIVYRDGLKPEHIGYLPQQTSVQKDFPASVKEVVLSGCQSKLKNRAFYSKKEKAIAVRNMRRLEIERLSKRCYRELSGGQQQRVLLARALCATERMLVLDEPVSGLDPKVTEDMYELIYKLNKNDSITVIMISHDISSAVKYANRILHIGETVFLATVKEYVNSELGKRYLQSGVKYG